MIRLSSLLSIFTLADDPGQTPGLFHIVLRASHELITKNACRSNVTPNGRRGIPAICGAVSCHSGASR